MPIEALPDDTTRALGSSLVLNDAKSVVKELVDNALDARATTISVEISANTLDVVQVKDNGTGIDVQDRQLLCKRGCTSKIRTIDDLGKLGGTFLGFRGEALASIVDLSKDVVVTTRVEGETAGTAVTYAAIGMISSSSTHHPVGTTIRVHAFLTRIPVRKQTALKTATKTLESIKSLLFSFAFARPEVRFSVKVLKGKKDKLNWTYVPKPGQTIAEVATKIVGVDIASLCTAYSLASANCDVHVEDGWNIDAVLISASADTTKIRNAAQHVSVDGRPVNTERATMKEIVKSYKRHIQNSALPSVNSRVSRPFLYMQIRCPPESYDVNIEPAKDEVLFSVDHASQLMSMVECLFRRAYPEIDNPREKESRPRSLENPSSPVDASMFNPTMLRADRIAEDTEDQLVAEGREAVIAEDEDSHATNFRNPFTIAAMTTRVKPVKVGGGQSNALLGHRLEDTVMHTNHSPANIRRSSLSQTEQSVAPCSTDTSPPTSPRPGPPMARRVKALGQRDLECPTPHVDLAREFIAASQQNRLQTWLTPDDRIYASANSGPLSPAENASVSGPVSPIVGSAVAAQQQSSIPSSSHIGREWGASQKTFKIPSMQKAQKRVSNALPPTPPSSHRGQQDHGFSESRPGEIRPDFDANGMDQELRDIMDFEHRKKAAIAHQRRLAAKFQTSSHDDNTRNLSPPMMSGALGPGTMDSESGEAMTFEDYGAKFSDAAGSTSNWLIKNPHRNRYLKALEGLTDPGAEKQYEPTVTQTRAEGDSLEDTELEGSSIKLVNNDPRAYLMRQLRNPSRSKLHRTKSSKLPFESIFPGRGTFDLTLTTDILRDLQDLREQVTVLSISESYLTHGRVERTDFGTIDAPTLQIWEQCIRDLIHMRYPIETQEEKDLIETLKLAV